MWISLMGQHKTLSQFHILKINTLSFIYDYKIFHIQKKICQSLSLTVTKFAIVHSTNQKLRCYTPFLDRLGSITKSNSRKYHHYLDLINFIIYHMMQEEVPHQDLAISMILLKALPNLHLLILIIWHLILIKILKKEQGLVKEENK